MNTDMQEIKERLDRIEKRLELPSPLWNLLNCRLDFDLHLNPLIPPTVTQAIYINQMETRLKAEIHKDLKAIEDKINGYLRYC